MVSKMKKAFTHWRAGARRPPPGAPSLQMRKKTLIVSNICKTARKIEPANNNTPLTIAASLMQKPKTRAPTQSKTAMRLRTKSSSIRSEADMPRESRGFDPTRLTQLGHERPILLRCATPLSPTICCQYVTRRSGTVQHRSSTIRCPLCEAYPAVSSPATARLKKPTVKQGGEK
jgi:hypothetical protein